MATMVTKALGLLHCFRGTEEPMGLTELSRLTGLPKSTAFRLLTHLEDSGYVERHGKLYRPGRLLVELGAAADNSQPSALRVAALPHMADLYADFRLTVVLGVLSDDHALHIGRIRGAQSMPVPVRFGGRVPATCTALGKVLLAGLADDHVRKVLDGGMERMTRFSLTAPGLVFGQLQDVRMRGYAVEREECALGVASVAVPVKVSRTTVAALGLLAPSQGFQERGYLAALQRTAREVAASLLQPLA